ncbi:MAG TPA: phosphate ABC transporter permease subunit PstC [Candidatus Merdivicinus excrementipullorum]|uniref:Phosphate transport system permease protein n=1 Tax=Candidatus Merdivicinus excrementipullorum TaxID=2840867 RepID=A0A9D1FP60_9FIRM|nr:phosphate ABC transporter permease subunit PstC [Candidatus Merdivicinus excrementipullorum]
MTDTKPALSSAPKAQGVPERNPSLSSAKRAKGVIERVMNIIFFVCGVASVLCVAAITIYMVVSGLPAIREVGLWDFLTGTVWAPTAETPQFGILPMILTTILGTFGAIVVGAPLGLFTAVFICYLAPKKSQAFLTSAVELLAGIPSVIYGLVGITVLSPLVAKTFDLPSGASLFTSIIVLAIMILPTIVSVTITSLRAVPQEYYDGSLALGATSMTSIFKMNIRAAKSGIITGIVLGIGRAIGETMAIIMVSGNVVNMPNLFGSVRFLTTGIVSEMSYAAGLHREALFSIGLILFIFIFAINLILTGILKKGAKQ